jgi:methionine-rich copper-binding protein CopC
MFRLFSHAHLIKKRSPRGTASQSSARDEEIALLRHVNLRSYLARIIFIFSAAMPTMVMMQDASAKTIVGILQNSGAVTSSATAKLSTSKLYAPQQNRHTQNEATILLAHAIIVRTSPPQGGVAPANIGKVDVWYDAGIRDSLAALAVVSASGERIDKRDAAIDSADPAHVSVSTNPMAPGKYTVRYRALSADGHMVSGAWEFDVQP